MTKAPERVWAWRGVTLCNPGDKDGAEYIRADAVTDLIAAAVVEERKQCAKVCRDLAQQFTVGSFALMRRDVADECAEAIRQGGQGGGNG
jgi:hypothetical protein